MNENNKISYYAVIPATILFNERLKANEKLLYAVITALSNKEGYCYASNKYLAEKLNVDPKTISSWVTDLRKQNFIYVEILRNEKQEIIERKIYPHDVPYTLNNGYPYPSKNGEGIHQKIEDNRVCFERSDGKIGFEIIKDEMVSNQALVPKLCFNTLIENAFYHGINPKPDQRGMVKINITKKDDKLICSVTDDGIGMSKEEILSIKEQIDKFDEMPLKCIGLANIKFRIELLFGRNGTFDILSEKGMGTTIYVSIPYEEKE